MTAGVGLVEWVRRMVGEVVREEVRAGLAELRLRNGRSVAEEGPRSITSAAAHAAVAPGTLRRWIRTGRLPVRRAGRQEPLARELAAEAERLAKVKRHEVAAAAASRPVTPSASAATVTVELIGPNARPRTMTVKKFGEIWLERRKALPVAPREERGLEAHVYPLLGHMAIADVRPRHIRDLVLALKQKTSDARTCKGERLAPRTVRHVYALIRRVQVGGDRRPHRRQPGGGREGRPAEERRQGSVVAGLRHGEVAGLRWRDYDESCEPLGKLIVRRSYERDGTKTQITREIPAHPTLALILGCWRAAGWEWTYGRKLEADDLIVPTEAFTTRASAESLKRLREDLKMLGFRRRRGHDLRRTFITLAQVDGARRDILKPLTHPGEVDIVGMYTSFPRRGRRRDRGRRRGRCRARRDRPRSGS